MSPNTRHIVVYLAIAFGLSWLISLPLWFGEGINDPSLPLVAVAMMATPAIATLIVVFFVEKPTHRARTMGLWPLKPLGRLFTYLALAIIVPVALILAALPIGAALGLYNADFTGLSAFRETIAAQVAALETEPMNFPVGALIAFQFINVLIGSVLNIVPALGEELGWRGWLLPKLMPLGTVKALLISGVIWGLWHSPLVLLGYNYTGVPGWLGVVMMIGTCIVIGSVFAWLRIRSESVWPAALAHGAFNAAAGFSFVFAAAGSEIDTVNATILGWSGWIVPIIFIAILLATNQFRPATPRTKAPRNTNETLVP
jgi:membrane protease YdiL (CAAX protease family)